LATLAAGLQSHRPELLDGIGLIVGIDKFMSEARALTNFSGNAVATVVIGGWTKTLDRARMSDVLNGKKPFDEQDMVDDHAGNGDRSVAMQVEDHRPPAHV
jgi:aerobic C4-dicarboxylate transport protein